MHIITSLIPRYTGIRARARILKVFGIHVGHGSTIMGTPFLYGSGDIYHRLCIGDNVVINIGCTFELNEHINIGDHVAIGHEVMILTSSHHIDQTVHRAGPLFTAPVCIENGAWIGARSVIMPGVTVGSGSVVGAGAIVTKNVPPNTLVGGVPARMIRAINE
ncbi:acyltransferase [Oscillochloris sp. ZM17-4]|nr:acyltransferase [Oscillochloris sp. ZM17-4]